MSAWWGKFAQSALGHYRGRPHRRTLGHSSDHLSATEAAAAAGAFFLCHWSGLAAGMCSGSY